MAAALAVTAVLALAQPSKAASATPKTLVVLGDSLVAGYGLAPGEAFPDKLQRKLVETGLDVTVINAGVSGDTSAGGLARLDWSVPDEADAVIVELGANDALRGISPDRTRANLDEIVKRLKARGLGVLIAGMLAPPNMGEEYGQAFNAIFPQLATAHDTLLYPFFLDGVAAEARLNQADGMHPTAAGIDVIVGRFVPYAEQLVERVR